MGVGDITLKVLDVLEQYGSDSKVLHPILTALAEVTEAEEFIEQEEVAVEEEWVWVRQENDLIWMGVYSVFMF